MMIVNDDGRKYVDQFDDFDGFGVLKVIGERNLIKKMFY